MSSDDIIDLKTEREIRRHHNRWSAFLNTCRSEDIQGVIDGVMSLDSVEERCGAMLALMDAAYGPAPEPCADGAYRKG